MADPKVAAKQPSVVELEPGKYFWCSCGESQNQPFCDGSHKGSEFKPHLLEIETTQKIALCQCKRTADEPRCDGTHNKL